MLRLGGLGLVFAEREETGAKADPPPANPNEQRALIGDPVRRRMTTKKANAWRNNSCGSSFQSASSAGGYSREGRVDGICK
jgi:hypothetical protein